MKSNHAPFGATVEEIVKRDIENGGEFSRDVASEAGQLFDNVKHLDWFYKLCLEEYRK